MLIEIILPLSLLLALGYSCIRFEILSPALLPHLSQFVIKISLPAFLVVALASKDLQAIWQPIYIAAYGLGSLIIFALTLLYFRYRLKRGMTQASLFAMGASMSNTGFIGSAVLTLLLESHAAVYLSLTLIIENLCIVACTLILAEGAQQQQNSWWRLYAQTLLKLVKNPVIIAIILGMLCAAFKLQLPHFLTQTLRLLGQTASPLALFIIGAGLVGLSFGQLNRDSVVLVAIKLLLMPITIFALFYLFSAPQEMRYAGTLLAVLPMPVAFVIFADQYGIKGQALAPLMLSTLVGFLLLALLLSIWQI